MTVEQQSRIVSFIWGIADDVLRDLFVRGKYRDVVLPMTVRRRLDAVLEPTKHAVLDMKEKLDHADITNQDAALRHAFVTLSLSASRCATSRTPPGTPVPPPPAATTGPATASSGPPGTSSRLPGRRCHDAPARVEGVELEE